MDNLRSFAPRLLAGFGTLTLLTSVGLFASRPARTAGGPVPVTVSNTVLNRDADRSTRQPFQQLTQVVFSSFVGAGQFAQVPAGKRLVIESLSARDDGLISGKNSFDLSLEGQNGFIGMTLAPGSDKAPIKTQPVRMTVEAGDFLNLTILSNAVTPNSRVTVCISGYYVDVP